MLVYRITLAKYAGKLVASGRAARWNPNKVEIIYTASSQSLACLENVVHRNKIGLDMLFSTLIIEYPDHIKKKIIHLEDLPSSWSNFDQMHITQKIGANWVSENESAILQVPSSIIKNESNFLINPRHEDFNQISISNTQPFVFDKRIKG